MSGGVKKRRRERYVVRDDVVRPVRLERMAFGVGVQRSIQLSYGRICRRHYTQNFC